jgi:hypothetical protein
LKEKNIKKNHKKKVRRCWAWSTHLAHLILLKFQLMMTKKLGLDVFLSKNLFLTQNIQKTL